MFKLEVGKRYITSDGSITRKIESNPAQTLYPYKAVVDSIKNTHSSLETFTENGRFYWSSPNDDVRSRCLHGLDIIKEYKEEKEMYPSEAYTRDTALALNAEKRFLSVDKENGTTQAYTTIEEAKTDCTRKLREGKEFLIVELVCSVRPKPIDAEIEEY